ncbi:MAG: glycine/sarcosine/betaine reductase selenoprotein B family protein [Acidimicrobiia bacterium]
MADAAMRAMVADMPVPEFATTAFTAPPALAEATVAIVTTAGLMQPGEPLWREADDDFRVLAREERELLAGHQSTNWDRTGLAADLNVAYPVDRLEELADEGVIGAVAPRHLSFTGPIMELSTLRLDTGPAAAQLLLEDSVDVVLLTPV